MCPTGAFTAPYVLDARRCLSYWSIEHEGVIPEEFHIPMGNRIFGCDDCYAVCPWNKFAAPPENSPLRATPERSLPALRDLPALDEAGFRQLTQGSPMRRLGYARFLRNCLIAAGNADDPTLHPLIAKHADHPDPTVRLTAQAILCRLQLHF